MLQSRRGLLHVRGKGFSMNYCCFRILSIHNNKLKIECTDFVGVCCYFINSSAEIKTETVCWEEVLCWFCHIYLSKCEVYCHENWHFFYPPLEALWLLRVPPSLRGDRWRVRSWVWFQVGFLEIFSWRNPFRIQWLWGPLSLLTQMSNEEFSWG